MTVANFLPDAAKSPNSVGLSLSGGGYRATLFHFGALRRFKRIWHPAKADNRILRLGWGPEDKIREALRDSGKRTVLGHG
jgi:hypothetical protein